jgi:hypothetical protein
MRLTGRTRFEKVGDFLQRVAVTVAQAVPQLDDLARDS